MPVALLIFLLVPEAATDEILSVLSEIVQMLSDRKMRDALMTVDDAQLAYRIILRWKPLRSVA